jgi:hypothetical protein
MWLNVLLVMGIVVALAAVRLGGDMFFSLVSADGVSRREILFCSRFSDEITNSTVFNFGIFTDAQRSGVADSRDFSDNLFYCF